MDPFACLRDPLVAVFPALKEKDIPFTAPPKVDLGDVAVPCFFAAKRLKMPPAKIASELAEKADFGRLVEAAEAAGPYLNLRLNRPQFARDIVHSILEGGGGFGSSQSGKGQRVLLEHTSINPNASPHVGRARNAMIGDSLGRLFRFEDYDVEVHYYVDDMGRQMALLVLTADELEELDFDGILDVYVKANQRAEEEEAFAKEGYELLARMEQKDPEAQKMFAAVTDLCLKGQLQVLSRLGATYDVFDRESDYVSDERLDSILAALKEKGALFTDEHGRLVVDCGKLGLEREEGRYFVLRRGNGSSLYGYRDLAYTVDKESKGAKINLIVLGEDHKLYFQQVSMILEAAGHQPPEAVHYSYILLKEGKMSTRQGNVVLLSDFLDQATELASKRVDEHCSEYPEEERKRIAEQVAVGAMRFTILRVQDTKNVIFEMDEALSFTGDTGPYIQYSCARIQSILRKFEGDLDAEIPKEFPVDTDSEWLLLSKLATFPRIVASCHEQRTVAPIAVFVLEAARAFTAFYHDCPVLTADTPEQVSARIQVCQATFQVLRNALHILGIEVPERM